MTTLKRLICLVMIILSFGLTNGQAQDINTIKFKSASFLPEKNIDLVVNNPKVYHETELINGHFYRIIQFAEIPSQTERENLKAKGIRLLNYIPHQAYYAEIKQRANLSILKTHQAIGIYEVDKTFKLSVKLAERKYDDWALDGQGNIELVGMYYEGLTAEYIQNELTALGAVVRMQNEAQMVKLSIKLETLNQLYESAAFYYFEQIEAPSQPENLVGVTDHRSNTIATAYANGLKYDGSGVTVMLQDNSVLDEHIDYSGRFFNDESASQSGDHGEHCGGIIGGAGNLEPTTRGMAYGSRILVYNWNNNNYNDVPDLYEHNDLTITSKSYGNGVNAGYTGLTFQMDQQTRTMPSLVHVFSAGNSNGQGNTSAGSQWFNITGGHKAGKNVIAVGNVTLIDGIANSSSRGPAEDGRIKPDICAVGTNVNSTVDPNTYDFKTGTSMACPGVAGTLAQLYHAYKDINGGVNPPSGLMKATILNTADDLGNPGPDFTFGWGRINARKAFDVLSQQQYIVDEIDHTQQAEHTITVPGNVAQLKVMVYWTDFEASPAASTALVNDIDAVLTAPNGTSYLPWVLNSNPNSFTLNQDAQRGTDHLNNMEQITIDLPSAGDYTLDLTGFSIPQGPQTYYVVYEFISKEVVLTYPIGGEGINSSANERIRWDAFGTDGTFTLEFSKDNGVTWETIDDDVSGSDRSFNWNVPSVITGQALVRVTRGNSSSQSHAPFSVIRVPTGLSVNWVCENYMEVSWYSVSGASGYEVSVLGEKYMEPVGRTSDNTMVIPVSGTDGTWWSVKALGPDNCVGRRARARFQSANTMNCTITTDVATSQLDNHLDDRVFLSCTQSHQTITIDILNLGGANINSVPVYYQLNDGTVVNEIVNTTILPGDTYTYTFDQDLNLMLGNNKLSVWSDLSGDQIAVNDTVNSYFNLISSASVLPLMEDFETFELCGTNNNCDLENCTLANDFINETNGSIDDVDWRTNAGETPSLNTGPTQDVNPGSPTGKYLYIETSDDSTCYGKTAHLISPCIDLTDADTAKLSFAYHMLGKDIGALHIDILINGVWTNDITPVLSGDQGSEWKSRTIDLTPYKGQIINIRFRGVTGQGNEGNIAIDDIKITGSGAADNQLDFMLYPNPSTGIFNFEYNGLADLNIEVHDANGRRVKALTIIGGEGINGTVDLSDFASGVYVVTFNNSIDKLVQKVVKQ